MTQPFSMNLVKYRSKGLNVLYAAHAKKKKKRGGGMRASLVHMPGSPPIVELRGCHRQNQNNRF